MEAKVTLMPQNCGVMYFVSISTSDNVEIMGRGPVLLHRSSQLDG
jgi:hypothetical protein